MKKIRGFTKGRSHYKVGRLPWLHPEEEIEPIELSEEEKEFVDTLREYELRVAGRMEFERNDRAMREVPLPEQP